MYGGCGGMNQGLCLFIQSIFASFKIHINRMIPSRLQATAVRWGLFTRRFFRRRGPYHGLFPVCLTSFNKGHQSVF